MTKPTIAKSRSRRGAARLVLALMAIVAMVVSGLIAAPPAPAAPSTIVTVVAGWQHSCALTNAGAVWCWGANDVGQLGDGTTVDRSTPVAVVGLSGGVTKIAAGAKRTCAVLDGIADPAKIKVTDGIVKCWGDNSTGALGDGTTVDRSVPTAVVGVAGVKDIAVGTSHTCAASPQREGDADPNDSVQAWVAVGQKYVDWTVAGTVGCWGLNDAGQLGNGTTEDSLTPTPALISDVVGVTAGGKHTCAWTVVRTDRFSATPDRTAAKCWGDNAFGQLGDGTGVNSSVPVEVSGLQWGDPGSGIGVLRGIVPPGDSAGVTVVAAGDQHTCARGDQSHVVKCFGRNHLGQLGDGTTTNRLVPVDVVGLASDPPGPAVNAISIASGRGHSCAPVKGLEVALWCWGSVGPTGSPQLTAQRIPGMSAGSAGSVGAGDGHTCVVVLDGKVECLGTNSNGQLGNATTVDSATAVLVQFPALEAPPVTGVTGSDLIITVAGNGTNGYSGDGGSATRAMLNYPRSLTTDIAGNLYIEGQGRVRKVDASGVITTVAGTGTVGYSGDGGLAVHAKLGGSTDVEMDQQGNLYLADWSNKVVRRVDATSGIISTVAGNGTSGDSGDGGPAKSAQFESIGGLALDGAGRLYISDSSSYRVRVVTPDASDGVVDGDDEEIITTVAGTGKTRMPVGPVDGVPSPGAEGDGGQATTTQLVWPGDVETDATDNLYISQGGRIRKVDTAGIITTVAGNNTYGSSGDGGPATSAQISASGIHVDASSHLYLTESHRVRKVVPGSDGSLDGDVDDIISTVAGTGTSGYLGDGSAAGAALLYSPTGVGTGPDGALYVADMRNNRIRRIGFDGPLRLTMVDSSDPVRLGGELTYTATVTNFSSARATGVVLTNLVPAGTSFVSASPDQGTCNEASGTINCALGEIGAGAKASVAIMVSAPSEPATLTNRAQVSSNEADPYVQDNIAVEQTIVSGPDLRISLTDAPDPVVTGGEFTYTATVTNSGPGAASGISLSDILPTGSSFRSFDPGNWTCTEVTGTVGCALAALGEGGIAVVRITVGASAEPTTLAHTATVTAVEPDPAQANNTDTETTAVLAPVDLSVATTDTPEPATVDSVVDYTLRVSNNSALRATGVVLTDTLPKVGPGGVTYRSTTPTQGSCSRANSVVTCNLGSLAGGASAEVHIAITPTKTDLLSNTAAVRSYEPEANPADNTDVEQTVVSTTGVPTGLGLATVDRPDPVAVGEPLTYEFTATNGGPVPATGVDDDPVAGGGVILTDTLPAGVVFDSATSENGTCSESGGTVTCELGTIDSGAYVRAAITVVPTSPATLTNNARVSASNATEATSVATTVAANAPCGQVITKDTVLQHDIGPCASVGIMVGADNVTLDLGGHRIFGTAGPSDRTKNGDILGNQPGIYVSGRTNVTVKNGTVTDFDAGVFLEGGGSHTITGLVIRDNIGPGGSNNAVLGDGIALFDSANNRIVANSVIHNGIYDGIGVLGGGSDGNVVENNVIEDTYSVKPPDPFYPDMYNHGQGIMVNASSIGNPSGQTIQNTQVVHNIVRRSAAAGISNINQQNGVIFNNTIEDNGGVNGPANGIGVQRGPGARTNVTNLIIQSNEVHRNKASGISLLGDGMSGVTGNKILNNDVAEDSLSDGWGHCNFNTWSGNTMPDGYSPTCTAVPDTTGPDTTIVSGPGGPSEDDTPTFEFSSPEPASKFECRVDTEAFATCTSPHTTAALGTGPHRFEVKAIDPAGNADPAPAIRSFVVGSVATALGAVADFDGNGATDISVFRPTTGTWFSQGGSTVSWGTEGDIAVPGDYDGDQSSDVAVFRPSNGTWFVQDGPTTAWGTSGDVPVPGDYDGDKKADLAVFRPSSGVWFIHPSGGGPDQVVAWGTNGDIPVPGDYNGDGTTEIAVFRPSSGIWFVNGGPTTAWGTNGDVPVPGDYDANGATDMAVFRPSSGTWFVSGGLTTNWGTNGDIPVPGDFDANGTADVAVFRPSIGAWFVQGGPTTHWGTTGDQPLPLPAAIRHSL